MDNLNSKKLELIFGPESRGDLPEERAKTSKKLFIRGQDHLAEYRTGLSGMLLSAWECFNTFGINTLFEVIEYGSAILPASPDEPSRTLREERERFGRTKEDQAKVTGLSTEEIDDAENPNTRSPIQIIKKIAQKLCLDERTLSFVPGAKGNALLACRLRELGQSGGDFSSRLVSPLCEAAWVISRQYELGSWIYPEFKFKKFEPSYNYGNRDYPAWMHGYYLAGETRKKLGITDGEPIHSLRKLTEDILGIPVIQLILPATIAGATVANHDARGIAINIEGDNKNVWIRRITIAHELGHLLWDPNENLKSIILDKYEGLEDLPEKAHDYVEQRANAFAVEFIAPIKYALEIFNKEKNYNDGLRKVMETFGISYTSAKYHILNGMDKNLPLNQLYANDTDPTPDWTGRESFTVDYFKPESVPLSRRGKFSYFTVLAEKNNLITKETASFYLDCSVEEYEKESDTILSFF
jgi:Zn-dependent peptidase ImmA (M78 family)